jgi:arginine decarboxylase
MTCDSDRRIDHYVDGDGIEATLPLPEGEDTKLLAFFLTGAYQEILGDMHNLFGDTDAVDIRIDDRGAPQVTHMARGQTLENVLEQVNYRPQRLLEQLSAQLDDAGLPPSERFQLLERVRKGLESYTYLAAD